MTQGELEKIPSEVVKAMSDLEIRIMEDMVRRIRVNGFSTASADWQFTRLEQLGMSEQQIKAWVQEVLGATDEEIERIYSDEAYQEYMGSGRAYKVYGRDRIPFDDNVELQQLIEAVKRQTGEEMTRITGSMGFVTKGLHGNLISIPLTEFYQRTLDNAMYDIHSGAFDYNSVLGRVINDMTNSGLRWIDYESGHHNRVPVAARRAVMTGFRQVQEKINEQVARDLGTDSYEVTVHIGARPTHQVWEGQVWTMDELHSVCGLGTVTGLHGANCYHDYNAFIPGVSVRTYTDDELKQIHEQENKPKTYNGKEYTTYEALQRQRQLETRARKYREDVHLLQKGDGSEDDIIAKKARYQGTLQEYRDFSRKMDLPMQKERIYQDGLKVDMRRERNRPKVAAAKPKEYEDITEAVLKRAKPGKGSLLFDNNVEEPDKETSRWLFDKFGGDLHCLEEQSSLGKMPDLLWDGIYWEFKAPTTKNAIDDRIRQGNKQLLEALSRDDNANGKRGMVINITNNQLNKEDAIREIIKRAIQRKKGPTTIYIRHGNELVKAIKLQ